MMTAADRERLDELKGQVNCPCNFVCITSALADLCGGTYHRETDIFECQEPTPTCGFCRPLPSAPSMRVCTCALRKFIAVNFDRWSTENTKVLRGEA
jgi:hypothetical protein